MVSCYFQSLTKTGGKKKDHFSTAVFRLSKVFTCKIWEAKELKNSIFLAQFRKRMRGKANLQFYVPWGMVLHAVT